MGLQEDLRERHPKLFIIAAQCSVLRSNATKAKTGAASWSSPAMSVADGREGAPGLRPHRVASRERIVSLPGQ